MAAAVGHSIIPYQPWPESWAHKDEQTGGDGTEQGQIFFSYIYKLVGKYIVHGPGSM